MTIKQTVAAAAAVFTTISAADACQTCGTTNPVVVSGPTANATANATVTTGAVTNNNSLTGGSSSATTGPVTVNGGGTNMKFDAGKREASSAFANAGIPTNLCDVKKGGAISLFGVFNMSLSGYKNDKELSQYDSCFALMYESPQIEALTGNTFTSQAHAAANHPGFTKALEATVFDEKAGGDTQPLSRSERLLRATTGGTTYVKGKMTIN